MVANVNQIVVADGDLKVLDAFERLFAGQYRVKTFDESEEALKWLKENHGVSVIVSCANLPGRGGSGFLKSSETYAPLATRVMLTAQNSVEVFKQAVNEAGVFMFLSKPCSPQELSSAIEASIAHHSRMVFERTLLEKTLSGSVKLLIDMLSLFHSEAFRRTAVMRPQALKLAKVLEMKKTWELEMAIMFSPLGEALLPKEILSRYRAAKTLTESQREILAGAPGQTRDLLKNIPQLEKVAEVLYLSGRGYDGSGFPEDGPTGKDIPLTARVLKLLTDLWYASPENGVDAAAFEALGINKRQYDPDLLKVARACLLSEALDTDEREITLCYIRALKPGDELVDDILTEGTHELVLSRGHQLTGTTIRRLDQYNHVAGIRQPIRVHRPAPVETGKAPEKATA
ncbi:HD domain-containing phosphohydrolase [Roseibium sp.]|uniref:HD domain-containing phosphohydrolase n=2 Tax=Roseibium sp. TaxID=1936156 RepID=UPI003264BA4D